MQTWTGGARIWAILVALAALGPAPRQAAAVVFVYWDQNEEEDFFVDPAGPIGLLIPSWDPNGQMAILPGASGSFVVGYNPTLPSQNNPGSLMPAKDPPVGLAEYDKLGNFTGRTIFVPGPYALPGSTVGGDIPPDQSSGNEFNNNGTYTGVVFDPRGNLFAVDIGTAQGQIPPPDNGRLIEIITSTVSAVCETRGSLRPTSRAISTSRSPGRPIPPPARRPASAASSSSSRRPFPRVPPTAPRRPTCRRHRSASRSSSRATRRTSPSPRPSHGTRNATAGR